MPHLFGCNNCGETSMKVGEARYISLGCRAEPNPTSDLVDLCEECMKRLMANNDELVEASMKDDHYVRGHPWLRVLYNVKGGMEGYYEF